MKKSTFRVFFILIAVVSFFVSSARADLGLGQILANQGAPAVGQAVLSAAQAAYSARGAAPAAIQTQLIAILNEAAATGNEQAVRYAIVAVMMAGGVGNLELSETAINNSNVFANYEAVTARTVAATKALMTASGGATGGGDDKNKNGGGGNDDGDKEKGGGDPKTLGGGSGQLFLHEVDPNDPFTWKTLTGPGDGDIPATRI